MMHCFKIIVPSFNCVEYLPKCLRSIEEQTDRGFDVCVIDDGSTIAEQKQIIDSYCSKNGWVSLFHEKNEGALFGLVEAVNRMNPVDDDVIVIVDGDDWLKHSKVLEFLRKIYSEQDIALTWGQCELYPQEGPTPIHYAQPIPDFVVEQKLFRDIPFVFWHLVTFKFFLWRHIHDEDLRDEDGSYFRIMKDKATLYPMLEMAGHRIRFIDETLYVYNTENPLNDYANTTKEEHDRVDALLRGKKKYSSLQWDHVVR